MLPLENITVDEALMRSVKAYPDNIALSFLGRHYSYLELDAAADCYASKLLSLGVKHGEHIGIWCETEPKTVFMIFAAQRIGAVAVMVNTGFTENEALDVLYRTDVKLLAVGDGFGNIDFRDISKSITGRLPCLKRIVYIGLSGNSKGLDSFDDVMPASTEALSAARAAVRPSDDGFILFTSGTTARPRAVVGTQFSRANSGLQQAKDLKVTPADRFCVAMPTFHCFCLTVNVMAALFSGACLCLPKSRHVTDLLETVEKEKCTVFSTVPALFHAILSKGLLSDYDHSSLRTGFIGGSPYPPKLFEEIEAGFGFTLLSSLGQTEATAGITTAGFDDPLCERSTTVGHFMDNIEYKIAENGEICVKGYVVMKGYYNDPIDTKKAIDSDGWLHTGDAGYINENGNLVLTGRIKEFIIRGGENISPRAIEAVLDGESRIDEVKAIGVSDTHYGEQVALCVIRKSGTPPITEKEILDIYEKAVAKYKVPGYVVFMEEFPKTVTGKILTDALRRKAEMMLGL